MKKFGLLLALGILTAACQPNQSTLSIGIQPKTELTVLAQMVRQIIESNTDVRVHMVECRDWIECAGLLRQGRADLIVEYSGTGYMFRRHLAPSPEGTLDQVRKLYEPVDIQWLGPFGFNNTYWLVVPHDRARTLGLKGIADLNKIEGGVRITAPSSYVHRPVDGLPGLLRHYGLTMRGEALLIEDSFHRLLALHNGQADVAIVGATDGALRGASYTTLEDTLHFYPKYEAAVVTRTDVTTSHPQLLEVLGQLTGKVSKSVMQELNYQVDIEGLNPEEAAYRFLRESKFVTRPPRSQSRQLELIIAIDEPEGLGGLATLAVRVVREAFPDHHVVLQQTDDAVEAVGQGKARLAVLGADRLIAVQEGQLYAARDNRIEAVAVLQTAYLHILRRRHEGSVQDALTGKLGVHLRGSERAQVALEVLHAAHKKPVVYAGTTELVEKVKTKELDAALIFHLLGDGTIHAALDDKQLVLHATPPGLKNLPPYFTPVRIASGTYPGQTKVVNTVGVQIVVAGPSPITRPGPLGGGPASGFLTQNSPVSIEQANALAQAIGHMEPPDPILPSVWRRSAVEGPGDGEATIGQALLDTGLNIATIVFLGWLGLMLIRRPPR